MIIVNFHGATTPEGEFIGTFQRRFPDMQTWERVRDNLRWTYSAIEVEEVPEIDAVDLKILTMGDGSLPWTI